MHKLNLRALDLNLLVLLDLLIEHRSVTRAAAAAHMSQPAMSRALGRLRAMLNDPILARGAQGLVVTPRIAALRPTLTGVLREIDSLFARERFEAALWEAEVTIAATDHQTMMLLPALVARLRREAPRLTLTLVPIRAALLTDLLDGRIHLSFSVAEAALPPGLRSLSLYADDFVTLLRQDHPAIAAWSLETFVALDHVLVTVLGDGRGAIDDSLAARNLKRRIALRLPHFYAALAVVAASDLAVTLPRTIAVRHAPAQGLAILETPVARGPFVNTVIWSAALDADPGLAWLRGIIREEALRLSPQAGS